MKRKIYEKLRNILCALFGHVLYLDDINGIPECDCGKYPTVEQVQAYLGKSCHN